MLIFISDLHFVDESAGKHNIPTRAFEGVFDDIKKYGSDTSEIKIVFLGDVFDINRTTYWFGVDESERPWGDTENKMQIIEGHVNKIIDAILEKNKNTFDIFKGSFKKKFGFSVEPEKIYIPGNHDRLCNIFPSVRKKVRESLGIKGDSEPFNHVYDDRAYGNKYGVLAKHGHEYDIWNYEGSDNFTDSDYTQIPIGDLITTEIASRLPYTIMKHVGDSISTGEKENLKRNLEEIENVRPYSAIFNWLFYKVSEKPGLKESIEKALSEIVENFNSLNYLKRWYKRHDKWNLGLDEADKLQGTLRIFKHFDIESAEKLVKIYSKIFGSPDEIPLDNADKTLIEKAKDFLSHRSDYRFCVMGHTHSPMQIPVRITSSNIEQMYLNTGTWRARYIQCASGGFVNLKYLTYTIFYSEEESKKQRFETWTGALKEEA